MQLLPVPRLLQVEHEPLQRELLPLSRALLAHHQLRAQLGQLQILGGRGLAGQIGPRVAGLGQGSPRQLGLAQNGPVADRVLGFGRGAVDFAEVDPDAVVVSELVAARTGSRVLTRELVAALRGEARLALGLGELDHLARLVLLGDEVQLLGQDELLVLLQELAVAQLFDVLRLARRVTSMIAFSSTGTTSFSSLDRFTC